ncbi:MAG: hypothetical protein AB7K24_23420, partial [Gemmataceae bacterium]
MNDADKPEPVERLIAERFEERAEAIDAAALIERIRAECLTDTSAQVRPARRVHQRWPRWAVAASAIAAGLLLAFLGGRYLEPAPASAAPVLRGVRANYVGVDRCYQVLYAPDPRHWNPKKKLEGPSQSVLWTRGDRFWSRCTIGDMQLSVGQERDGTLWVSPGPRKGIRFNPDKVPADVALICAISSMNVPRLLDEVLADFDIQVLPGGAAARPTLIRARLKPGRSHRLISDALLEIDTERNLLVRMVLWTTRDGVPKGTVTYTLSSTVPQEDKEYLLRSHLNEDAVV